MTTPDSLRASDADRSLVTDLLTAAYAEGRITREELDDRVARTLAARTFADLTPITADLVPGSRAGTEPAPVAASAQGPATGSMAIFSSATKHGRWQVPATMSTLALFGSTTFDLTEATFETPIVELDVACLFGSVDVIVPPGMAVRNEVAAVFGSADTKRIAPPQPGQPTIVLRGFALFGSATVKGPRER